MLTFSSLKKNHKWEKACNLPKAMWRHMSKAPFVVAALNVTSFDDFHSQLIEQFVFKTAFSSCIYLFFEFDLCTNACSIYFRSLWVERVWFGESAVLQMQFHSVLFHCPYQRFCPDTKANSQRARGSPIRYSGSVSLRYWQGLYWRYF